MGWIFYYLMATIHGSYHAKPPNGSNVLRVKYIARKDKVIYVKLNFSRDLWTPLETVSVENLHFKNSLKLLKSNEFFFFFPKIYNKDKVVISHHIVVQFWANITSRMFQYRVQSSPINFHRISIFSYRPVPTNGKLRYT